MSMTGTPANTELVFLPLGGIGEIGLNAYLYGIGPAEDRQWLMVDCGITFPDGTEPGVDVVLPDLRFIEEERFADLPARVYVRGFVGAYASCVGLDPRRVVESYMPRFDRESPKRRRVSKQD